MTVIKDFAFDVVDPQYPDAPYGPSRSLPEWDGTPLGGIGGSNIYMAVRKSLAQLGLDYPRFGGREWNPLGALADDLSRIVLKPNLVLHGVPPATTESLVSHASVIRPLIDYAVIAQVRKYGEVAHPITIADTPLQSADLPRILCQSGYDALMAHYRDAGIPVRIVDCRQHWARIDDNFHIEEVVPLPGDPEGIVEVDLGFRSFHESSSAGSAHGIQDYDQGGLRRNHGPGKHIYGLSGTIAQATLLINVPKFKTHSKAGVTLALKNMIGANVSKDYLPHFRAGAPEDGGDEYPRRSIYNRCVSVARKVLQGGRGTKSLLWRVLRRIGRRWEDVRTGGGLIPHGGAWAGNDTLWRTILDVNAALFNADLPFGPRTGAIRPVLIIGDGVVGAEGEGPLKGSPKNFGVIAASINPVSFDYHAVMLMGFRPEQVPHIIEAARRGNIFGWSPPDEQHLPLDVVDQFEPPHGWRTQLAR